MAAVFHFRSFRYALLSVLATCSAIAQENSVTSDEGLLELNSGDFLRGSVENLENSGNLTWKHSLTEQKIRYNTDGIRQILFKPKSNPSEIGDVVWLGTGDRFICRVESITDTEVIVVSSILGERPLHFKRDEVAGITLRNPSGRKVTLVGGSMEMADWDVPSGQIDSSNVSFKDGNMIIEGSFWPAITRKAEFPESFIINAEIDWKNSLGMRFEIGASDDDNDIAKVSLTLELQTDSIRLQRVTISEDAKRKSYSTLVSVREIDKFTDGARSIRLQAYINSISGDCSIYINNQFAGKSDGPLISSSLNESHILGSGIHILQKSPSPVRIRSLAINQWDGRSLPSQPRLHNNDSDHIYFEDGDNTKGKIIGLKVSGNERVLSAEIPYSDKPTVSIPAAFLDYFTFGNNKQSKPENISIISAHLTDGSVVHLSRLKSGDDSMLDGVLIGGYGIKIPAEALAKLSFSAAKPQEEDDE